MAASIHTILFGEAAPDDIYDIVVLAPKDSFWPILFWCLGGLLILLFLASILFFLFRKPKQISSSPEALAFRRLREAQERRKNIAPNEYTLSLSETLKDYLAEKFDDPVRFETTPEFLSRVAEKPSRFPVSAQQHLQSFLVRAEEVKFGNASDAEKKAEPLGKIAEQVIQLCQIVNERESDAP